MIRSAYPESTTIIPFPTSAVRADMRRVNTSPPGEKIWEVCEAFDSWYHEEAIREAQKPAKPVFRPYPVK